MADSRKRQRDEGVVAEEELEEYTVGELLETALMGMEMEMKVKFVENPQSWTMMRFQSSSSYVTINGNEESCGPSFSDSESSVMASVDTVGLDFYADLEVERWLEGEEGTKMEMDGGDWEDQIVMAFLGEEESSGDRD